MPCEVVVVVRFIKVCASDAVMIGDFFAVWSKFLTLTFRA
jgi:hypothetical protein